MGLRQASAMAMALLAAPVAQLRMLPRAGLLCALPAVLKPLGPWVQAATAATMRDQFNAGRGASSVSLILDFAALRRAPRKQRPLLLARGRATVSPGAVAFPTPRSPPAAGAVFWLSRPQ